MEAKPLDYLGFPKHELLEDGTIRQTVSGRIISKPSEQIHICQNNKVKAYGFKKVLYCAQNDIHISKLKGKNIAQNKGAYFSPETAQTPPPDYGHYIGDLDHIGLPGYTLYIEGVYKKDTGSIQFKERHGKHSRNPHYAFQTSEGRITLSAKKLQWCADNAIHYTKVHGQHVCVTPDGRVMQQADYCRWLNDKYRIKDINVVVGMEERMRRLDVMQKEHELIRRATITNDYSEVAAYVATLEDDTMLYVWCHARHFSRERRAAIWSYAYDMTLIMARNGQLCNKSIERTIRNIAHKAAFIIGHGDGEGGSIRFTDYMIRHMHNEDDELPYQYD